MKAIAKYPGSKWSIADWIISYFPEHHSYLEPFFGSGAVFFNKPRSHIETVNDLDGNVVNLFECIRDYPEQLARAIYYTPYARSVYERVFSENPEEKIQKALNFYTRLNMGHGFRTNGERVGWKNDVQGRERSYASQDWCHLPDKIMMAAERLRGVQIENMPAVELIRRFNYDKVLIYCDPPYMLETRYGKQYRCEMDDKDHVELLETLLQHKGPVVISGYETDLYNSVLAGNRWKKFSNTSRTMSGSTKQETIWMNYNPHVGQMSMFTAETR